MGLSEGGNKDQTWRNIGSLRNFPKNYFKKKDKAWDQIF
jgi:hypothetical protein